MDNLLKDHRCPIHDAASSRHDWDHSSEARTASGYAKPSGLALSSALPEKGLQPLKYAFLTSPTGGRVAHISPQPHRVPHLRPRTGQSCISAIRPSSQHTQKQRQIRLSSPKTTQTHQHKPHPECRLVPLHLLHFKDRSKTSNVPGQKARGHLLCFQDFAFNLFTIKTLQFKSPAKSKVMKTLRE